MSVIDERILELDKKYIPIVNKYKRFKKTIKSIEFNDDDDLESVTCKIYLITNSIGQTVKSLNLSNYRKHSIYTKNLERKIRRQDVMKILRNIDIKEKDKYKRLAREQYKDNGGLL